MAYHRTGTYSGPALPDPATWLGRLSFQMHPAGYGHVDRGQDLVRELFSPFLAPCWPGAWDFCTVVRLDPGGQLPLHTDDTTHTRPGARRHHLVLRTNPLCWLFHGGAWQQLEEGGLYTMDPTVPHGGVNWGATVRLHLVVDAIAAGQPERF